MPICNRQSSATTGPVLQRDIKDVHLSGVSPEAIFEGYNAVTSERVLEMANKYLPDQETGDYVLYIGDPLKK